MRGEGEDERLGELPSEAVERELEAMRAESRRRGQRLVNLPSSVDLSDDDRQYRPRWLEREEQDYE